MNFSVRLGYPENAEYSWREKLQEYYDAGRVEVAFFSAELFLRNVKEEDVTSPFPSPSPNPLPTGERDKVPLQVSSVHMAHARITDFSLFEEIFRRTIEIAKALNCENIIVHPSKAKLEDVLAFIEEKIDPVLRREKVYLCWETFTSRKRFLSGLRDIAEFCRQRERHRACYDFSHIHNKQDAVMKEIDGYLEFIKIFHISNRISEKKLQHLPVFYKGAGQLDLEFVPILRMIKERDFSGDLVLEYLPEFHSELKKDSQFLVRKFG